MTTLRTGEIRVRCCFRACFFFLLSFFLNKEESCGREVVSGYSSGRIIRGKKDISGIFSSVTVAIVVVVGALVLLVICCETYV